MKELYLTTTFAFAQGFLFRIGIEIRPIPGGFLFWGLECHRQSLQSPEPCSWVPSCRAGRLAESRILNVWVLPWCGLSSLRCLPWESRLVEPCVKESWPLLQLLPYLLPSLQWFQLAGCGHSFSLGPSYWGSLRIVHWRSLHSWGSRRALVTRASPDLPPPSHWFWHWCPIVWIGILGFAGIPPEAKLPNSHALLMNRHRSGYLTATTEWYVMGLTLELDGKGSRLVLFFT